MIVKVGIGELLVGADAVATGFRQQTETTESGVVESRGFCVGDDVILVWIDTDRKIRFEFETLRTGAVCRGDGGWQFATLHVSTPGEM